jgi:polysaccharide export outer membrane protein
MRTKNTIDRLSLPFLWVAAMTLIAWADVGAQQKPSPSEYIVGPNDVLSVMVFNQEKLTNKYTVGADGTLVFPMLGSVQAGGLTVQAIERQIRDGLAKTLREPQVSVSVDQYRSQQIFVFGQVRQPLALQYTGSMSVAEALTKAGGITEKAGVEAHIVRSPGGGPVDPASAAERAAKAAETKDPNLIRVDLSKLLAGDFSQNVQLRAGDFVSVPLAQTVFVQGQVARTGEYPIRPGMTVQQVLALAGGITDRGTDRRMQIIRQVDGKKTTYDARNDDVVRGGDIINVRQKLL